jgi:hypothetical protein
VAEFDVYGRMRVRVVPNDDGWCRVYAVRGGGKLHALDDVAIPADASNQDVIGALEAVFHEIGQPGSEITRVR